MTSVVARTLGVLGLGAGLAVAGLVQYLGDTRFPAPRQTDRVLFVQTGATARQLALTFRGLAADVYWIRTIQHYGGDLGSGRVVGRFDLLEPLLDMTTSLDPQFAAAYRYGAMFLAMPNPSGAGRVDEAVALLEKGLHASPARWQYAYDIGFVYYLDASEYRQAGLWFGRAAAMPHAPEWLRPLAATTLARGGDRAGARQLLTGLRTADQPYLQKAATRGLKQLDALEAIDRLQALVAQYQAHEHAYPSGWSDLVRMGLLPGVPVDEAHVPFLYDPESHQVSIDPRSPLVPLPTALAK